jgi:hypothetical protein
MAHTDIQLIYRTENHLEAYAEVEGLGILARTIQRGAEGKFDELVVFYDPNMEEYLSTNTVAFRAGEPHAQMGVFKLYQHDTQYVFRNGKRYSIQLGTWDRIPGDDLRLMFHFYVDIEPFVLPSKDNEFPEPPAKEE